MLLVLMYTSTNKPLAPAGYEMLCQDTDCHEAVRLQNLDVATLQKLDEHFDKITLENLIDIAIIIKSKVFGGNGKSMMQWNGGNVAKQGIEAMVSESEKKPQRP